MKKLVLKKWVQGVLAVINAISLIMIMCVEINILTCLVGIILFSTSAIILGEYGTLDKIFD